MTHAPVTVTSHFDDHRKVTLDLWGDNPLLADYRQIRADLVESLSKVTPPPTLFESGDLPPFTASGVDPQVLKRLPYRLRHAAAAETSAVAVLGLIEEYGNDSSVELAHTGLDQYRDRIKRWLLTTAVGSPKVDEPTADENYEALFGSEKESA